jgi:hypothetical protein
MLADDGDEPEGSTCMSGQWEYCSLVSHGVERMEDQPGWLCRVSYFTQHGVETRQLREAHALFPTDVFERAMAHLGAGGWEIVSLQHELVDLNTTVADAHFMASVHTGFGFSPFGVAYFKRLVEPGRAIDEPAFTIEPEERAR